MRNTSASRVERISGPMNATDPALLSKVAEMVLQRIETKLNGTDFGRYAMSKVEIA